MPAARLCDGLGCSGAYERLECILTYFIPLMEIGTPLHWYFRASSVSWPQLEAFCDHEGIAGKFWTDSSSKAYLNDKRQEKRTNPTKFAPNLGIQYRRIE